MNTIIDPKALVYFCLGFVSLGLSLFLGRLAAFEDQAYLCGMLIGFAIVLLPHAVYFAVKNAAIAQQSNDGEQ